MTLDAPAILASLPGVVYTAGAEGLSTITGAVKELTGSRPEDLLGSGLDELLDPRDLERVRALRAQVSVDEPQAAFEYRLRRPDGSIVWVRDRVTLCPETLVRVGTLRDISGEKRAQARRDLQARLAIAGDLAAGVVHAINNPLSAVLNYGQLAERVGPQPERVKACIAGILSEGERILQLTQSLLTYARGDQGLRPLSVSELVGACLTLFRRKLRDEFIIIACDASSDLPLVRARGTEVHEALHCLIDNATDALNARFSGRSPDKKLAVRAVAVDGSVRIEVEDAGEGIEAARHAEVFAPFVTTRAAAVGLGLTIARSIAEEHSGSLTVRSEGAGLGAVFELTLPTWVQG